jgi:hypothetical protein
VKCGEAGVIQMMCWYTGSGVLGVVDGISSQPDDVVVLQPIEALCALSPGAY